MLPQANYIDDKLYLNDQAVIDLAIAYGTPSYVYNAHQIINQLQGLMGALHGIDYTIHYALKANRFPPIVALLRQTNKCHIDVCSPEELRLAHAHGFRGHEISYNGTNLSNADWAVIAQLPCFVYVDSLSALRKAQKLGKRQAVGLRLNLEVGMAYSRDLEYSGAQVSKFGIYRAQWAEAAQIAAKEGIQITRLHHHPGSGYLSDQIDQLDAIFSGFEAARQYFKAVDTINIGGGLGVQQQDGDAALNLIDWSRKVQDFAHRAQVKIHLEPGDYLVKNSGMLLLQINTIEQRKDITFIGLNGGMNINYEVAYYGMHLQALPLIKRSGPRLSKVRLAGNINEPIDLFGDYDSFPFVEEGDYIALLNTGGYGSSTASNHCMRGQFGEYLIYD